MTPIITIIFFVFGSIIGSFLNVVILRYNTHRTFGGRSGCMVCQNPLSWHELIPLFSFLILGGKCKSCRTKISWQYPVVELLTGLIFAGLFLKFEDIFYFNALAFYISYAYYAMMFSLLMIIAVYDLKHKIIPDMLALFLGVLSFIGIFFFDSFGFNMRIPSILEIFSGVFIALPFAIMWFASSGKWMGLGDAKLALALGWLVGLSRALSGLVVAFWSGAIIGILLIALSKKYGMKSEIPFAPFLVLGIYLAFVFELHLFGF